MVDTPHVPNAELKAMERRNRKAQWAYDTRPVLGRFHLWLEDIDVEWFRGEYSDNYSFMPNYLERCFTMTTAVTALGTYLFGRYGEGKDLDKQGINQVKKDADAVSAYVMSEGLWFLSRNLPENHAVMVCLGEGLMPKAGETPEMGSNPLLGFGRVYARPMVASKLDHMINRMINEPGYGWEEFYDEVNREGITIWGTAIDTLENTSRFAKGKDTGPMAVLHVFNQPLNVTRPYEGYMATLVVPGAVKRQAEEMSILLNFLTPREMIVDVIEKTYPGIKRENIHVWTLRGKSREERLGKLWAAWKDLGCHLIDDGDMMPTHIPAFTDSGTYAPTYLVKPWQENNQTHVLICDGYAASAEAMQAASLAEALDVYASMAMYTSKFKLPYEDERHIMRLDPNDEAFETKLTELFKRPLDAKDVEIYRQCIVEAHEANMPMKHAAFTADEFFPEKQWRLLALSGYMLPDPYSGASGVEKVDDKTYRVVTRASTKQGDARVSLTLRLMEEDMDEAKLVFSPLLDRFYARGKEYYETRPVRVSDSGRIRNELQTLAPQALEYVSEDVMRLDFSKVDDNVLSADKKAFILEVLTWYKTHHPIWFDWLEIA